MTLVKLILYISIVLTVASCSEKPTVETHLASAKKYLAADKIKESEIELKNAIMLDVSNAEARFELGRLYLSQGAGLNAIKELEKAQSLKYPESALLTSLARAYLISDDYDGVLSLAKKSIALPNEDKVEYLSYQTLSAIQTNQPELAKNSIQEANNLIAGSPHVILANAYLALLDGSIEKAELLVKKSLSINENNPEALMFQGQVFTQLNDFEQAGESYKKYVALQPLSRKIYLILAETLMKTEDYLEAEKYADLILQAFPNQPVANYVKAVVRFAEKDYTLASQFSQVALSSEYKKSHLKLVAGASAFHLKNYAQASFHLEPIIDRLISDHPARKMYAISQFQQGLIDDITDKLENFTPTTEADAKFMSNLSFSLFSVGAKEDAKKLAEDAAKASVSSSAMRQGLLKLMMDDPSGIIQLEQTISEHPEAQLALAYAEMQAGNYEKALTRAKKWQEKFPKKADSYNLMSAIYSRQENIQQAQKLLLLSLEKEPDNVFALNELIKISYQTGDENTAKQYADKAISLYPENIKTLKFYYIVNRSPKALSKIEGAYKKNKNNVKLNILYMEVLAQLDNFKTLLAVSSDLTYSIQTPKKVWQLRVFAYQKLQQGTNIQSTLKTWLKTNPYHVEPVLLLTNIYNSTGQKKKALSLVNNALEKNHSTNLDLKLVKMQLLLDNRQVTKAKSLLVELKGEELDKVLIAGISGRIDLMEGKLGKALPLLQRFYETYDSSQNVILVTIALQGLGKEEQAIQLLEDHLVKKQKDHRVRNVLAGLYVDINKDNALKHYQILVEAQPLNIVALNNLAWLTMDQGNLDEALVFSEEAYQLAPKLAKVVDTYSQVLLRLNKKREALVKSRDAYGLSNAKDINITLNFIELLLLNSRNNEAKTILSDLQPKTESQKIKAKELKDKLKG
ncbi:MAG: PEP-CTERM system TPR-repeat protein PrsT [Colwellia sp.]|nr:PEP-CTERM system TPR-repeat protein PrsT [Colwellia sp.]